MKVDESFGPRIRRMRKLKGYTLQQVGDRFSCTRSAVASWERGETRPDQQKLSRLSKLYGVSLAHLLTGELCAENATDSATPPVVRSVVASRLVALIDEAGTGCFG